MKFNFNKNVHKKFMRIMEKFWKIHEISGIFCGNKFQDKESREKIPAKAKKILR